MLKQKIKIILVTLLLSSQILPVPSALAGFLNARAYGTDTVAGYASLLKTSMVTPGREVVFVVEKPDYSVVRVPAKADPEGIAKADLYGHQTKMAGDYRVAVNYPGTADVSLQSSFKVYPDQVSATQSTVSSTVQMVEADGVSSTFITVTLYDPYRNPIKDHLVKVISSRSTDVVQTVNGGMTDKNGRASVKVTSKYSGVSVFTAMDASANTVLTDREEIVFYAPSPKTSGFGGNFLSSGLMQADILQTAQAQEVLAGPVASFEIEDLPSSVKVNADTSFTVVAKDKDGNVAKNYTGTILISTPDDENAVLPNNGEYTFKESDLGRKTFDLSLRFSQTGNQFIQILDKNDWKISGEKDVQVTSGQAVITPGSGGSLVIKSPVNGAKFGSNLVIISGNGNPNINLKVFDDDVKIGDTETDSDGFFSFQASNLSGGFHTFYVMGDNGQVSGSVSVNIDTVPPVLNSFQIYPEGVVRPGETLTFIVNSEPNLDQVKIRLQGIEKELLPESGQSGSYTATMVAPAIPGSFPVDVILIDDLANRSDLLGQKSVLVQEQAAILPPQVQNVEGVPGDSEVLLTWNQAEGHTTSISAYKIYYGTAFDKLDQVTQVPGSETTTKIKGLENKTQYFFAVSALDSKSNESGQKSTIIALTPVGEEEEISDETDEPDLLGSATEVGDEFPDQASPGSLYNNPLTGVISSGAITLMWQPFPGVNAAGYKLYFGLASGQYDDYVVLPASQTSYTLQDLINNVPYYFAVVALDGLGGEASPFSAEYRGVPSGSGFHSAPLSQSKPLSNEQLAQIPAQQETGAASVGLMIVSFFGASMFYFYRRRWLN